MSQYSPCGTKCAERTNKTLPVATVYERAATKPELKKCYYMYSYYEIIVIFIIITVVVVVVTINIIIIIIIVYKKLSCRRETARRLLSLNILLSHSRSLKVIRNYTVEDGVYKSVLVFH